MCLARPPILLKCRAMRRCLQWPGLTPIWDAVNVPCVPPMTDVMAPCLGTPVRTTAVLFRSPLKRLVTGAPVLSTSFHLPPIFVPVGGGTRTRCFSFVRAAEFTELILRSTRLFRSTFTSAIKLCAAFAEEETLTLYLPGATFRKRYCPRTSVLVSTASSLADEFCSRTSAPLIG